MTAAQPVQKRTAGDILKIAGTIVGPLITLILFLTPPPTGLPVLGWRALGLLGWAVLWWIFTPIPAPLMGFLLIVLMPLTGVAPMDTAFSGFANPMIWIIVPAYVLGIAVSQTGLAKRLSYQILMRIGVSYQAAVTAFFVIGLILTFFIPSGFAKLAMLMPLAIGIIEGLGAKPESNIAAGITMAVAFGVVSLGGGIYTGTEANPLMAGMILKATGKTIGWGEFAYINIIPALAYTFCNYLALRLVFPAPKEGSSASTSAVEKIREELRQMGPLSANEKKALAWLIIAILLWSTDLVHHINPTLIGIIVAVGLLSPRVGVLSMKDLAQIPWPLIIYIAAVLMMGTVFMTTGVGPYLAQNLLLPLGAERMHPIIACYVLMGTLIILHLALDILPMLATIIPVLFEYAKMAGLNPTLMPFLIYWPTVTYFFWYQSSYILGAKGYGQMSDQQGMKYFAVRSGLIFALLPLVAGLWWSLTGLWYP